MGRKIFDCVVFNDELDLLELRLRTAAPFVDAFVVVEADRTFSGLPKPLRFAAERERFAPWEAQIRHVVVDDMPVGGATRWPAEVHQRNALLRGLDGAADDDVVIVADVDEILHPEVLAGLRESLREPVGLEMPRTFRYANWELPPTYAATPFALRFGDLDDPHTMRNHHRPTAKVHDAGRHFTSLGGVAEMTTKFEAYSHDEMDNERQKQVAYLARAQRLGVDVFSKSLVRPLAMADLCPLQRELLAERPDLFEFGPLPPRRERLTFSWYARWRARQELDSPLVERLDRDYDAARLSVPAVVGLEVARHAFWKLPRRQARRLKDAVAARDRRPVIAE